MSPSPVVHYNEWTVDMQYLITNACSLSNEDKDLLYSYHT